MSCPLSAVKYEIGTIYFPQVVIVPRLLLARASTPLTDQTSVSRPAALDMDMYEINSRRRNRRANTRHTQPDDYPFKSIPNLSIGDYDSRDFYSLAPAVYNTLEGQRSGLYRSLDTEKMYRSLGYIPCSDTAQHRHAEEEVQPSKK